MAKKFTLTPYRTGTQFGREVRAARDRKGMTQGELAKSAGVGLKFLYQLEHGKETLRIDKVMDVLDVLSIRMVFLPPKAR